jgi:hypothetical protein
MPDRSGIQDKVVSLQEHDRYCEASAGRIINAMNTSTNANRAPLRHSMFDALLAAAIIAMASVGLAATAHADEGTPAPDPDPAPAATAPAPPLPWLGWTDPGCTRPLYFYNGRVHCG